MTVLKWVLKICSCSQAWNSWNHFACDISESLIKQTIDAMVYLGFVEMGYNYINLDDCWQATERSLSDGAVVPDPERFPNGMKDLSTYAHSKGLKNSVPCRMTCLVNKKILNRFL